MHPYLLLQLSSTNKMWVCCYYSSWSRPTHIVMKMLVVTGNTTVLAVWVCSKEANLWVEEAGALSVKLPTVIIASQLSVLYASF